METEERTDMIQSLKAGLEYYRDVVIYALAGLLIGLFVAALEIIFGLGLQHIVAFYQKTGPWLLAGLPFAGLIIVWLYRKSGGDCAKGMTLLYEVDQKRRPELPKPLALLQIVSTWITHLFGGSAGREGVAIVVGGWGASLVGKLFSLEDRHSVLLITGMAAGFAGLFGTPFTAVFFALEVLTAGIIRYRALVSCLIASLTASAAAGWFGLEKEAYTVTYAYTLDIELITKLVLLGLLFGLAGRLFVLAMHGAKTLARRRFPNPYRRIFFLGILAALVLFLWNQGRYSNTGAQLIYNCFHFGRVYWYDWLGKLICTVLTLAIGFTGGEVMPLFTIGSTLGFVMASFFGLPPAVGAMLGLVAVFASGTNTFLAPLCIGMELFSAEYFPLFFICAAAAYVVNRKDSIYHLQKIMYDPQ